MNKTKKIWSRECKKCGKPFEAFSRYSYVCEFCKEQNLKKGKDKYYEKYLERRKKRNGI